MKWTDTLLSVCKHRAAIEMGGEFTPRTFWSSESGINGDGWSIQRSRFVSLEWLIVPDDGR
jgi:hypothetical protein